MSLSNHKLGEAKILFVKVEDDRIAELKELYTNGQNASTKDDVKSGETETMTSEKMVVKRNNSFKVFIAILFN